MPAPGSNVEVREAGGGAEVVQIVGANPHGLSHNRYNAHDVGPAGAVYNNAVQSGQSQLAGPLAANPKLGGRAATVILNEVISRNPSLLLGQMEVFGQAANLVLANPNGITCNGCGFINSRHATLLVGTPQLQDGRLQALSSAAAASRLTVGAGGISANSALDLIAPRIDAQGALVATSGIRAVIGQALLNDDTGELTVRREPQAERLDSAFLGGMQAGRISIVSTDDGAGVNLVGAIRSDGRIEVDTQGPLGLANVHLQGEQLALAAKTIDATPLVYFDDQTQRQHDESWFIWKTGETDAVERTRTTYVDRTLLEGDQVSLRAQEGLHLKAAEVRGGDIRLDAGDIALTGIETHDGYSTEHVAWLNSWRRNQYTENGHYDQQGVVLAAERNLELNAQGRIEAQGAVLSAKNEVRATAGKEIVLSGLAEKTVSVDRGDRYLEGATLSSGNWNNVSERQQLRQSEVDAGGNLLLRAAGAIALRSSKLQAGGDFVLNSEDRVDIGTQVVNQSSLDVAATSHWGGIGGSNRANDRDQQALNVPSEVRAQGALRVEAGQDIQIVGSTVKGEHGAYAVTRRGSVQVAHATDLTQSQIDERRGGVFDIQTQRRYGSETQQVAHSAQLTSDTNLTLASGADVAVDGSQVEAGGALTVSASGDIRVGAATTEQRRQHNESRLAWEATAAADARRPGAYRAGAGLAQTAEGTTQAHTTQTGAILAGGSVQVDAGGDVSVQGSEVTARQGDAVLNGSNLAFDAAYETRQDAQQTSRTGGGIFVAASIDQLRAGDAYDQSSERTAADVRMPKVSQVSAGGDLVLHAPAGTLKTEGAQLGAGGRLSAQADTIDNRAAFGSSVTSRQSGGGSGEVAGVAELNGLLKPVEAVLDKVRNGQWLEAAREAAKIKDKVQDGLDKAAQGDWTGVRDVVTQVASPSAGGVVDIAGRRQKESASSQSAAGSRFEAAEVNVKSTGVLHDEATQYRASRGKVEIAAGEHRFDAAAIQAVHASDGGSGGAMVEATTLTGHDLQLKGAGNGSMQWRQQRDAQAESGAIHGAGGVNIAVAGDASYRGTLLDGGRGQLAVAAGGVLRGDAIQQTASVVEGRQGGSLVLSVRTLPQAAGELAQNPTLGTQGMGGQGKLGVDVARQQENRQEALPAHWSADAGVALRAGDGMALTGVQIGAAEGRERPATVSLTSGGAIDLAAAETSSRQESWRISGTIQGEGSVGVQLPGGQAELKGQMRAESRHGGLPSTIDARQVSLESRGELHLHGARVSGETVAAQVGGDMRVESLKDDNRLRQGTFEANLTTPNLGQLISGADAVRVNAQYEQSRLDAVGQASGLYGHELLAAQVGGQTVLTGGQLHSGQGPVATGGAVVAQPVPGQFDSERYGANFGGTLSTLPSQVVGDVMAGKVPLGVTHQKQHEDRTALPSR
ncbi:hemolysin [Paludibacterium purpuratum]|uniref:Hemolysin n=1 Tax=Paludibacterium purpuratum TaxID=1144873 RepID=A0A4R7B2Y1_9NEIS|nr:hemolysin [Paludibacterium purpuratum]